MPKTLMRPRDLEPAEQVLLADVVAPIAPAAAAEVFRLMLPMGGRYALDATVESEMLAATSARVLTLTLAGSRLSSVQIFTTSPRVGSTAIVNQPASFAGPPITYGLALSHSSTIVRIVTLYAGVLTAAAAGEITLTAQVAAELCTVKAGSVVRATYLRP